MYKKIKRNRTFIYLSSKPELVEALATLCDDTLSLLSTSEVTPLSAVQLTYSILTLLFHLFQF